MRILLVLLMAFNSLSLFALTLDIKSIDDELQVFVNGDKIKTYKYGKKGDKLNLDRFFINGKNNIQIKVFDNDYGGCWGVRYSIGSINEEEGKCDWRRGSSRLVLNKSYNHEYSSGHYSLPDKEGCTLLLTKTDKNPTMFWKNTPILEHAVCLKQKELFHSVRTKYGWSGWGQIMKQVPETLKYWKIDHFQLSITKDGIIFIDASGIRAPKPCKRGKRCPSSSSHHGIRLLRYSNRWEVIEK